ncbi:exodeoxyribonuclease VII large subunit [Candidatus Deianiraea vastatrix]|uniref:Exodeoxyribonuclease 7 large subunit n=1 Tax=Candidatus Deianiraea vastatrix TaxID=2163644 RepID=A0A5B8XEX8_9RICK|nr:exodeoxyribonuclease VII large subunit [Candidatus Deianiraea vastatrix]QED23842.1 Exodeoxyribonuclease 7 large subunit [Candidatus Deianiraea vastatrix]
MSIQIWSVEDISSAISGTLTKTFGQIAVRGEVSNLSIASSGHIYLSLKGGDSQISVVCFAGFARKISVKIENGMEIIVYGKISCYEGRSVYQIQAESIKFSGLGAFMEMLNERKLRLEKEGIFDVKHKKNLPKFPKKVAIITSEKGAVIHDILTRLEDRFPVNIDILDVNVQGISAALEIKEAILTLENLGSKKPDVIIIARGGGSFEDLLCFNDEELVRAIFAAKIPIISAIGHETDYTLCDMVSDVRAPTPTAAAEILVPRKIEIASNVATLFEKCHKTMNARVENTSIFIEQLSGKLVDFVQKVSQIGVHISYVIGNIETKSMAIFSKLDEKLVLQNFERCKRAMENRIQNSNQMILITSNVCARAVNSRFDLMKSRLEKIQINPALIQNIMQIAMDRIVMKIEKSIVSQIQYKNEKLSAIANITKANKFFTKLDSIALQLSKMSNEIEFKISQTISRKEGMLSQVIVNLSKYNYHDILKKGYVILKSGVRVISKIKDIKKAKTVEIITQDGSVTLNVNVGDDNQLLPF